MLSQKKIINSCTYTITDPHTFDANGDIYVTHSTINRALKRSENWAWTVVQRATKKGKPIPQMTVTKGNRKITVFRFRDFER